MKNPFHRSATAITGIIGKACMAGYNAAIVDYSFHDGMGYSCHLMITRRDQFTDDEGAFICMLMRYANLDSAGRPEDLLALSAEEDFMEDSQNYMVPVYGNCDIKDIPADEFMTEYDEWIDSLTGYTRKEENGRSRFEYNNNGIYRNGLEYSGNYRLFDPLRGIPVEKSFLLLNEWNRKEYFAVSNRYYFFMNIEFHSL